MTARNPRIRLLLGALSAAVVTACVALLVSVSLAPAAHVEATAVAADAPAAAGKATPRAVEMHRAHEHEHEHTAPPPAVARPEPQAKDRAATLVTQIRDSGSDSAPWMEQARALVNDADVDCYRDGCIAVVAYADELAFELADETLTSSEAFLSYPGWRHRRVERGASGRVTATWLLMNPTTVQ